MSFAQHCHHIIMRLSFSAYMQCWKSIMILSGIYIHTLQKQLCLYYNSLCVSIHFLLASILCMHRMTACLPCYRSYWTNMLCGYKWWRKQLHLWFIPISMNMHPLKSMSSSDKETASRDVYVQLILHIETCMSIKLCLCMHHDTGNYYGWIWIQGN